MGLALFTVYPELDGPVSSSLCSIIALITMREQISILAQGLPEVSSHQLPIPLTIGIVAICLCVDRFVGTRPGLCPPNCRLHGDKGLSVASCEQGDFIFLALLCLVPTVTFPQRQAVSLTLAN